MLTSYYIAGIVCVALAIWVLADRAHLRRWVVAFVTTVALALLAAVGVAAIVLHPYIARSRGMVPNAMPWEHGGQLRLWVQVTRKTWDETPTIGGFHSPSSPCSAWWDAAMPRGGGSRSPGRCSAFSVRRS